MPHYNKLIPHTTPSLVTFVDAPLSQNLIIPGWYAWMLSSSHQKCLLFLKRPHPQTKHLINHPHCHTFCRIILSLITVLNHSSLLILFYLHQINVFILLIKCGSQRVRNRMQDNLSPIHKNNILGNG